MKALGYDPQITVQRAWQLSSGVEQALSLDDLFARSDMVTVHVPLNDATRNLVNEARIRLMPRGSVILNFSRAQHRRRAGRARGARQRPAVRLRLRFPDQGVEEPPAGRRAAAPRRLDGRGRGELRDHGGGHAARLPRERQHPQLRQFPGGGAAAHRRQPRRPSPTTTCRTWSARSRPAWRPRSSTSPTC